MKISVSKKWAQLKLQQQVYQNPKNTLEMYW